MPDMLKILYQQKAEVSTVLLVISYRLSVFSFGLSVLNKTRDCLFSHFSLQIASVFFKEIYMEKSEFGDSSTRSPPLQYFHRVILEVCYNLEEHKWNTRLKS